MGVSELKWVHIKLNWIASFIKPKLCLWNRICRLLTWMRQLLCRAHIVILFFYFSIVGNVNLYFIKLASDMLHWIAILLNWMSMLKSWLSWIFEWLIWMPIWLTWTRKAILSVISYKKYWRWGINKKFWVLLIFLVCMFNWIWLITLYFNNKLKYSTFKFK